MTTMTKTVHTLFALVVLALLSAACGEVTYQGPATAAPMMTCYENGFCVCSGGIGQCSPYPYRSGIYVAPRPVYRVHAHGYPYHWHGGHYHSHAHHGHHHHGHGHGHHHGSHKHGHGHKHDAHHGRPHKRRPSTQPNKRRPSKGGLASKPGRRPPRRSTGTRPAGGRTGVHRQPQGRPGGKAPAKPGRR